LVPWHCLQGSSQAREVRPRHVGAGCPRYPPTTRGLGLTPLFSVGFPDISDKYLFFHRHTGLVPEFSTAALCFHRDSRFVRSILKKSPLPQPQIKYFLSTGSEVTILLTRREAFPHSAGATGPSTLLRAVPSALLRDAERSRSVGKVEPRSAQGRTPFGPTHFVAAPLPCLPLGSLFVPLAPFRKRLGAGEPPP
jgi:hypothetical protein